MLAAALAINSTTLRGRSFAFIKIWALNLISIQGRRCDAIERNEMKPWGAKKILCKLNGETFMFGSSCLLTHVSVRLVISDAFTTTVIPDAISR